jgi:site-specific DNA-methyltransferase (adenine-specific)
MFSFAGDTVLDPFGGTCATAIAAYRAGRNSVSNEIDPVYYRIGADNVDAAIRDRPLFGALHGTIVEDKTTKTNRAN